MNWRSKPLSASHSDVPAAPGVYVIGHRDTLHDFEIRRTCVYVGETKSLQRRLKEHLPETEKNPALRKYLRANYGAVLCWFARVDIAETVAVQNALISRLRPCFNTIGIPNPADNED